MNYGENKHPINLKDQSKLVYKSFRKGKVKVILPPVFNDGQEIEVVAKYELPSKFKIRLDFVINILKLYYLFSISNSPNTSKRPTSV